MLLLLLCATPGVATGCLSKIGDMASRGSFVVLGSVVLLRGLLLCSGFGAGRLAGQEFLPSAFPLAAV